MYLDDYIIYLMTIYIYTFKSRFVYDIHRDFWKISIPQAFPHLIATKICPSMPELFIHGDASYHCVTRPYGGTLHLQMRLNGVDSDRSSYNDCFLMRMTIKTCPTIVWQKLHRQIIDTYISNRKVDMLTIM